jgi:hypothetical protein
MTHITASEKNLYIPVIKHIIKNRYGLKIFQTPFNDYCNVEM